MGELALDDVERHVLACELDGVRVAQLVRCEAAPDPRLRGEPAELDADVGARPEPTARRAVNDAEQRLDREARALSLHLGVDREDVVGALDAFVDGGSGAWSAPTFEVDSDRPIAAGIDGEALMLDAPLRFAIRPGVLRVRVARKHPGASPSAMAPDGAWAGVVELARIALGRGQEPATSR